MQAQRLRSVARVFGLLGWFGVALYAPIVLGCIGGLLAACLRPGLGSGVDSPLVMAAASLFNGAILALAVLYVRTGRHIGQGNVTVRQRAIVLACVMMIGFPILTIVGVVCFRALRDATWFEPRQGPSV